MNFQYLVLMVLGVNLAMAADIPGGVTQTSTPVKESSYEVHLSPGYLISTGGAYLSTALRYGLTEEIGVGANFGAGEVGFHLGGQISWAVFPDTSDQAGLSITAGAYINRINPVTSFVVRLVPTFSKTFVGDWGTVTPYAAVPLSPSFAFNGGTSFGVKTSVGTELYIKSLGGMHLWGEFGLGIVNSIHELVMGISYPFDAFSGT